MANLFEAIQNNDLDQVRILIESYVATNANVLERDCTGYTPLHRASCNGDDKSVEIVKLLIKSGSDISEKTTNYGWTALHIASYVCNLKIVKLLVSTSMSDTNTNTTNTNNISEKTNDGWTALHFACENCHFDIVKFLVESGSDIEALNNKSQTTIDVAKTKEIKDFLIEQLEIQKNSYVLK